MWSIVCRVGSLPTNDAAFMNGMAGRTVHPWFTDGLTEAKNKTYQFLEKLVLWPSIERTRLSGLLAEIERALVPS